MVVIDCDGSTNHLSFKKDREGAIAPAIVESVPRVGVEVRKASRGYAVKVLVGLKSQSLRGIHVLSKQDNK